MTALAYRRTYPLKRGYAVEFELSDGSLTVHWTPDFPPKKIGRKLFPAYRQARNEFLASLGIPMLVVDL
jgi:hypothetical protein